MPTIWTPSMVNAGTETASGIRIHVSARRAPGAMAHASATTRRADAQSSGGEGQEAAPPPDNLFEDSA